MTCKLRAIAGGKQPPLVIVAVERRQQDPQNCGLELVESAVHAGLDALLRLIQAIVAQTSHLGGDSGVVGGDGAAVACSAQVFGRIETERTRLPERAGAATGDRRAVRLRAILDDRQAVSPCNREKRFHRRGKAVQMDRHDCGGVRSYCGGDQRGIDASCCRVDIDKNRNGVHGFDRGRRCGKCHRDRDHFVASADSERREGKGQRLRAGRDADRVTHPHIGRELRLESSKLVAENERATIEDAGDGLPDLVARFEQPLLGISLWNHLLVRAAIKSGRGAPNFLVSPNGTGANPRTTAPGEKSLNSSQTPADTSTPWSLLSSASDAFWCPLSKETRHEPAATHKSSSHESECPPRQVPGGTSKMANDRTGTNGIEARPNMAMLPRVSGRRSMATNVTPFSGA